MFLKHMEVLKRFLERMTVIGWMSLHQDGTGMLAFSGPSPTWTSSCRSVELHAAPPPAAVVRPALSASPSAPSGVGIQTPGADALLLPFKCLLSKFVDVLTSSGPVWMSYVFVNDLPHACSSSSPSAPSSISALSPFCIIVVFYNLHFCLCSCFVLIRANTVLVFSPLGL